ncbi:MAG: DUF5985 family protein [Phycisphaerae bacterium]|nr:DUF5985 family protein [Tepidisphaeraceae bacterium]
MAETVYVLCSLTSLACAVMLLRGYARSKARLLLWSGLCFVCLMANNVLLFLDKVVYPEQDLFLGGYFVLWRSGTAVLGIGLLVYGLVWDSE